MHVLHTFANNDSVPYLTWFAERARREGDPRYTFLVMYPKRPRMIDEMRALGFSVEWIPYDDRQRKRGMLFALPRLWWYMRRYRPDVVHSNLFDDSLPGMIAAWLAGIKVRVVTKQDTGFHWMHAPRWMRLDRLISRMATHVIAISDECERFLIERERADPKKVVRIHNGIPPVAFTQQDPSLMEQLRARFAIAGKGPIIGTVARFIEWKGYRYIIGAAARIVKQHPDARFLLCGTGGQENEIRNLVSQSGLDAHVIFTGWVDRKEMASFYGLLDIYLHAAILEPFGLVYAEAMMNGVPVVSTPTGAALDAIVDGKNGILVNERSAEALALGVERMLSADARGMGAAGKETALRMYHFNVMWEGTIDLYRRALDKQR
ncbi:MAG TPA: glycosyltransferase family 4 protein [Flavobacteriales bacterium]|nr:glycosyltransferase family 4 protein [Flavobacteriales bacterium]